MKTRKILGIIVSAIMALCLTAGMIACTPAPKEGDPPAATVSKIEVVKEPTKMDYFVGEDFDPDGLQVRATYSDKSTQTVDNAELTFSPATNLQKDVTEIRISYQKKTCYLEGIVVSEAQVKGKTVRFEAEQAEFLDGTAKGFNCSYIKPYEGTSEGYIVDVRTKDNGDTVDGGAWNDITLGGDGTASNAVGIKIAFTSSADAEATFTVGFSLRTTKNSTTPFSKNVLKDTKTKDRYGYMSKVFASPDGTQNPMYKLFLNSDVVKVDDYALPYATYDTSKNGDGDREYEWHTQSFNVNIKGGANEFVMAISSNKDSGAIDYIDITSLATVTNTTNAVRHTVEENAEYSALLVPTVETVGWLGRHCSVCGKAAPVEKLPALNATDYTLETTVAPTVTADGSGKYKIARHGTDYEFDGAIPATGEHFKYVFETEDATLAGKNNQNGDSFDCNTSDGVFGHPGLPTQTAGYSRAGNHTYIRTYFYVKGNTITFTLNAQKAGPVKFTMAMAKPVDPSLDKTIDVRNEELVPPVPVNTLWEAKLNGQKVFSDDLKVGFGYNGQTAWAATNCDWVAFTTDVELRAGENTVVLTATSDTYKANIDCITIYGAAEGGNVITNESVPNMHRPGYIVDVQPTATKTGKAVKYPLCSICNYYTRGNIPEDVTLPVLTDAGYTVTDGEDGVKIYTYRFDDGETVSFEVAATA